MNDTDDLKRRAAALSPEANVEATVRRLQAMNWRPEFLLDVPDFARISRDRLIAELESLLAMDDEEVRRRFSGTTLDPRRARRTQAGLLVNAAELLWRLRSDEPEAWDHLNELYEDD